MLREFSWETSVEEWDGGGESPTDLAADSLGSAGEGTNIIRMHQRFPRRIGT